MRGWSISLGRYFGVEVRLHSIFALGLPVIAALSALLDGSGARGVGLWLLLLSAVVTREIGRGLAEAASGHGVSQLVLLPTGAVPDERAGATRGERLIALAGPLTNFAAGITMALLMYAATPAVNLFDKPWVTPLHLLRSAIWAQVLLGGLHLLPAAPLDAGLVLRRQLRRIRGEEQGTRSAAGIAHAVALILILLGAGLTNVWMLVMGCSLLLAGRGDTVTRMVTQATGSVTAEDVMLTEFLTLSGSDTLADALQRSAHSLQDVFPVVRGTLVVGSISRDALASALRADGNGYVQGAMVKTVEIIGASSPLLPSLQRVGSGPGVQLLSVVRDEDVVVGILTPASLSRSMATMGGVRRAEASTDA